MKKIRGYRRKLRGLQQDCAHHSPLDAAELFRSHYDYAKLGLGAWHWHGQRLPKAVRQLAAQKLLRTFGQWQGQLTRQAGPFYLAVWLTEADFAHTSQVVAGIQERIPWYQDVFGPAVPDAPPLPPEYQQLPGADHLSWTTHAHEEWLDTFDYPNGWPAHELRRPHRFHTAEDGEQYLIVQIGWVWVGQFPK
ncbi:hypothetical protein [Hymenobacter chitinivorans]|uniref:Uncharacterized protein n=1 Tax=Hymenobacter chitinivorans DSM 11115 TaxID=1121954 RepID=A0A2M9BQL7_9BACT|nr:hypothetical protein [Hymenobacter chitinivorans]PJJ60192.1 hypothetical protein CLV45_1617 [Hymenobacter chitinivorans DSM 11115]